ncbi:hypothetical protein G4B88_020136 [Cannabis sativa]|uniref:Uncharacterized protein n=1 Tax=Cannabis sativa TaxID=3483 RepID=A0A7J6EJ43_CANSA|nr:hypothetical protein G4B88_020136 [Cannabis sativa]
MQQCNDFFFLGTKQISMGRVGDDFWFQDPNGDPMGVYWLQGVHIIHCAPLIPLLMALAELKTSSKNGSNQFKYASN